jgi:tetratricopeptide (TPR) repeat protein
MPSDNLPPVSPETRRIAAEQFDRANQVAASGNYDYAIQLLLTCCKLDPANFMFRQTLRRTQKAKFKNNLKGSPLASVSTVRTRAKLKAAKRSGDYLKVLEYGEVILSKNPWDVGAQMDMAEAADALGLLDHAVFFLDQARQKDPKDVTVNRALARLLEKRGNYAHAIALWQLIREADPKDLEAAGKAKDLAASETIARGGYKDSSSTEHTPLPAEPPGSRSGAHPRPGATPAEPQDRVSREAAPLLARLESNPTDAHLYLQLAAVYSKGNQPERARAVLEQGLGPTGNDFRLVLELMERDLETYRKNVAVADRKLGKAEKAEAEGEDYRHTSEDLRRIRDKLRREIQAREIDMYRLKADRFPQELHHRLELGMRLAEADRLDEAIVELQQARKDPRLLWKAALHLGLCFKRRNNWRLAQRNLEEALAQIPPTEEEGRKEILFQLAFGSAEAGELQKAVDLGHDLANLDFGFRDIGKLLDEWQDRLQEV